MIGVRIPKDTREYKEKIALGMSMRQLISLILGVAIVAPIYIFGRKYINEELVSWIAIIIAIPVVACGFFAINGMPFEKFLKMLFRHQFLYPQKRIFKSQLSLKRVKPPIQRTKKEQEYIEEATFEKLFLYREAEERGEEREMKDIKDEEVLTVRKSRKQRKKEKREKAKLYKKNKKKHTKLTKKEKKFNALKENAERIMQKQENNPEYIFTRKEGRVIRKYKAAALKIRKKEITTGVTEIKAKNNKMKKRKKSKTFIPKTAQNTLPYKTAYEDGLFEVEDGIYSKTFVLRNINFKVASEIEQEQTFCKWGEFLNYFSDDIYFSISIDNRIISESEMYENIHYRMVDDEFDVHRAEYNKIMDRAMDKSRKNIRQSIYFTLSLSAESPYEANQRFGRIERNISNHLKTIGSACHMMTTTERLELIHDKMRSGKEGTFHIDYDFLERSGLSSKDYVAPTSFSCMDKKDYFKIDNDFYRTMYISNMPTSLTTDFIEEMSDVDFPVMITVCVQPIAPDKALKLVGRNYAGMEKDVLKYEKAAAKAGYSKPFLPRSLKQAGEQAEILIDDIQNKSQKLFFVSLVCMVHGKTKIDLEENCSILQGIARKFTCQLDNFDFQQEEGYKVCFPTGINPKGKTYVDKALTTEAAAIFIPFTTIDLFQKHGYYYGINPLSNNLIMIDRFSFKTPSGFILGSSGSGKSFACKREIMNILLHDNKTSVLIIDPEGEYTAFCQMFGGTVINISAGSNEHINPMDMDENYGLDENDNVEFVDLETKKKKALTKKSDYIMSIIQSMMLDDNGVGLITPAQKSIVDRCVKQVYEEYLIQNFDEEYLPTLQDLQKAIAAERMNSTEAAMVAESMEYYTQGTMNVFAQKSNVDYNNRFVVFNIKELGAQLTQIALLIVLDFIWNRMAHNAMQQIRTYCYADEIHVLFRNDYAASYIRQLYKRGRKFGLCVTGITQDIEDLLTNQMARGMLSNSDFILMLSQKSDNLSHLQQLLGISDDESKFVTKSEAGCGLLFAEQSIVPFVDHFPESSYLYKLISTKFGEKKSLEEINNFVEKAIREQQFTDIVDYTDNSESDTAESQEETSQTA